MERFQEILMDSLGMESSKDREKKNKGENGGKEEKILFIFHNVILPDGKYVL